MRLPDFILENTDAIVASWVDFARTRVSAGRGMTDLALRDDAEDILHEIVRDMRTSQSRSEQEVKSRGEAADPGGRPSHAHAVQRARSGFEVNQMVAEYRALRATVLRLWTRDARIAHEADLEDVTRFNEAVDQALAESLKLFVSEVDRARSLFIGTLGHDLRTPLGTIAACAAVLQTKHPEAEREAGMISRSASRMRELLETVLSYTRRSLGAGLSIAVAPTALDEVVRNCVRELADTHTTREIALTSSGDLRGTWDATRLGQLTSNLIGNALKYGDPDRPVTVTVRGDDAAEVQLEVHNFGSPVPPEMLQDIFEPLVRGTRAVHDDATGANMGLGLYIAREVASAHFGSIRVESDADTGTVFTVRLPRHAVG